jgi:hypothetical protein
MSDLRFEIQSADGKAVSRSSYLEERWHVASDPKEARVHPCGSVSLGSLAAAARFGGNSCNAGMVRHVYWDG